MASLEAGQVMSAQETDKLTPTQWLMVYGAVLAAFMAVLDIQITNASLLQIQGGLSASSEESTWISTAYLVAEVIIIPMTGWLARVFSLRRYMLFSVLMFVLASILCGFSWSLNAMIVFRGIQGLFGGALIPLAFRIILMTFSEKERPKGMALFSLSAVSAPAFGPTLGGWLTDTWSWHMIFFINLIPGALMYTLLHKGLPREKPNLSALRNGDWFGIITMAVGLSCLQVVLEEGNMKDWFGSDYIVRLSALSAVMLVLFIVRQLTCKTPLVNIRVLTYPRFGLATLANTLTGFALYATIYLLPTYLGVIHGYSPTQIGLVIMWMGLPQLLIVPLVPLLMKRFGSVPVAMAGLMFFTAGYGVSSGLNPDFAGSQFRFAQLLRAAGLPLMMTPLSMIATSGLSKAEAADASSLYSITRNLGGAIGIAVMGTLLTNRTLLHDFRIRESLSFGPGTLNQYFSQMPGISHDQAMVLFTGEVNRQASIMSFADCYLVLSALIFSCMALVWLAGRAKVYPGWLRPVGSSEISKP